MIFTGPRTWGKSFEERRLARERVDYYGDRGYMIVQGGARGLDQLVLEHCLACGYRVETYYAKWNSHGRRAGPIRNVKMLSQDGVERVVGFRRAAVGWSKGTGHCVRTAQQMEIPVEVIEVTP